MSSADVTEDVASTSSGVPSVRKIRIRKLRAPVSESLAADEQQQRNTAMDRRIAELIPGLAELQLGSAAAAAPGARASALNAAAEVRQKVQAREEARRSELLELANIFDMAKPNAVDTKQPDQPWSQALRPRVRKVVLSPYQYEMINYQRMLMRKNIWYYRDRMNVPRGPCPLHVLKDAWVQGVIDENTLLWGQGLYDWLPAKNIKLLLPMVRTPEGECAGVWSVWAWGMLGKRVEMCCCPWSALPRVSALGWVWDVWVQRGAGDG